MGLHKHRCTQELVSAQQEKEMSYGYVQQNGRPHISHAGEIIQSKGEAQLMTFFAKSLGKCKLAYSDKRQISPCLMMGDGLEGTEVQRGTCKPLGVTGNFTAATAVSLQVSMSVQMYHMCTLIMGTLNLHTGILKMTVFER